MVLACCVEFGVVPIFAIMSLGEERASCFTFIVF